MKSLHLLAAILPLVLASEPVEVPIVHESVYCIEINRCYQRYDDDEGKLRWETASHWTVFWVCLGDGLLYPCDWRQNVGYPVVQADGSYLLTWEEHYPKPCLRSVAAKAYYLTHTNYDHEMMARRTLEMANPPAKLREP